MAELDGCVRVVCECPDTGEPLYLIYQSWANHLTYKRENARLFPRLEAEQIVKANNRFRIEVGE